MRESETPFASLAEGQYFQQWKEVQRQCEKLQHENDALKVECKTLRERLFLSTRMRPVDRNVGMPAPDAGCF